MRGNQCFCCGRRKTGSREAAPGLQKLRANRRSEPATFVAPCEATHRGGRRQGAGVVQFLWRAVEEVEKTVEKETPQIVGLRPPHSMDRPRTAQKFFDSFEVANADPSTTSLLRNAFAQDDTALFWPSVFTTSLARTPSVKPCREPLATSQGIRP